MAGDGARASSSAERPEVKKHPVCGPCWNLQKSCATMNVYTMCFMTVALIAVLDPISDDESTYKKKERQEQCSALLANLKPPAPALALD